MFLTTILIKLITPWRWHLSAETCISFCVC